MMDDLENPLAMFEAAQAAQLKVSRRYARVTRELFISKKGREWLALAMAKHNFMGSVFSAEDGMNPQSAAFRDGMRAIFSEILNTCAAGKPKQPESSDE